MSRTTAKPIAAASRLFHALSEPTRLQILEKLKSGEQCVCDLTEAFETGQSRLSFHLRVLKEAGLIKDRPEGRWTYYSLNLDGLKELAESSTHYRNHGPRTALVNCAGKFLCLLHQLFLIYKGPDQWKWKLC